MRIFRGVRTVKLFAGRPSPLPQHEEGKADSLIILNLCQRWMNGESSDQGGTEREEDGERR